MQFCTSLGLRELSETLYDLQAWLVEISDDMDADLMSDLNMAMQDIDGWLVWVAKLLKLKSVVVVNP